MWSNNQHEQSTAVQCSFCGKGQDQVHRLTSGPAGLVICNECVDLYRSHLEETAGNPTAMKNLIRVCSSCGTRSPASHHYCFNCGSHYTQEI